MRLHAPQGEILSARTKGQYTTAWPVYNLIVSGSAANNNFNGKNHSHTLPLRQGVLFYFIFTHQAGFTARHHAFAYTRGLTE